MATEPARVPPVWTALAAALLLAATIPAAQAADKPLREFVMPPGRDDGDPVPKAAPRARIQAALPGADAAGDQPFALACTAEEAAMAEAPKAPRGATPPRCPGEPFTVLAERP
jgi:hypothetical protein